MTSGVPTGLTTCTVDDCAKPHLARGYCVMHYSRVYRHGDVTRGGRPRGPNTYQWGGDEIGYRQAHKRLERALGKAATHVCTDCGDTAREWAFDEPTGYSTDISRYRPLCAPCHRRADRTT